MKLLADEGGSPHRRAAAPGRHRVWYIAGMERDIPDEKVWEEASRKDAIFLTVDGGFGEIRLSSGAG